jgi:putative transposase
VLRTVWFWWNRFGPIFAAEIRKGRVIHRSYSPWRWHLDEVFVRINGATHCLWRAVDHEGEVLEVFATKRRERKAALKFLKRAMKRYGRPGTIVTDRLRSYGAAMKVIGIEERQECGRWLNNRAENSHQPFRRRERAMAKFRSAKSLQMCVQSMTWLPPKGRVATALCRVDRDLSSWDLQPGLPSRPPRYLQAEPLSCVGRVASTG